MTFELETNKWNEMCLTSLHFFFFDVLKRWRNSRFECCFVILYLHLCLQTLNSISVCTFIYDVFWRGNRYLFCSTIFIIQSFSPVFVLLVCCFIYQHRRFKVIEAGVEANTSRMTSLQAIRKMAAHICAVNNTTRSGMMSFTWARAWGVEPLKKNNESSLFYISSIHGNHYVERCYSMYLLYLFI